MKFFLLALALLASRAHAFPQGAPAAACDLLTPNHGSAAQPRETSPYHVRHERNGDGSYRVVVNGDAFRGFMLQVRSELGDPRPLGRFPVNFSAKTSYKGLNCGSSGDNDVASDTITHTDNKGNFSSRSAQLYVYLLTSCVVTP